MAIRMLNWIIESTGAKIVISSTWRGNGLSFMQDVWKSRNLPGEIIDITPWHKGRGRDHLPFKERAERGGEIKEWLENHPEVINYLIIDDDDMLPEQENNFVQTDAHYGLTLREAAIGISILTDDESEYPLRSKTTGRSFEDYELEIDRKNRHIKVLKDENKELLIKREEIQADIRNKLSPMKTLASLVLDEKIKTSSKLYEVAKDCAGTSLECVEYLANVLIKDKKRKER